MIEELRKYFFHYRWLAVIFSFLLLKFIVSLFTPYSTDATIEQSKTQYINYLSEFGGKLTPEKEQAILEEFDRINDASNETNTVREQFLKGEINKTVFSEKISELSKITSREDVFLKIFEQYEYAVQNSDRREIIYTAGWQQLLTNESPDLLLVLLIVILGSQTFAREYENGMIEILLTSKNGRNSLAAKKFTVNILTSAGCTVLFVLVNIFSAVSLGLNNFSSPLESLPEFYNTPEHISLIEALVLTSLIKILGYSFFSLLVQIVSATIKKTLPTMCVSFGFVLIQYAGFGATDFKYRYAVPYGLMLACGYLKGENDTGNVHFSPIYPEELGGIITATALIFVLLAIFLISSYSTKKRLKKFALFVSISILLCGCENQSEDIQMFRLNGTEWTDSSEYVFSYLKNGTMINKATGESIDFIRDPFYDIKTDSDKTPITAPIFATNNKAYFLYDNGVSIVIKERNLVDMSDRIIYQSAGNERDYFLGLGHSYATMHSYTIDGFFLNDSYIYFITSRGITQINRLTSCLTEIITDSQIENVIFDGTDIFYISSDYTLVKYLSDSGTTEQVIPDRISDCVIIGDRIYYSCIQDGNKLYMCSLDGNEKVKLADYPIKTMTTDGKYIYYISSEELYGNVYRTAIDGTVTEIFYEGNAYFVYAFNGYENVIVYVHDESGMMTMLDVKKEW